MNDTIHTKDEQKVFPFWTVLFSYMGGQHRKLIIAAICCVLAGIGVAAQPFALTFLFGELIDAGRTTGADRDTHIHMAVIYISAYGIASITRMLFYRIGFLSAVSAIQNGIFHLRTRFFRHVQFLCLRFHSRVPSGELYNYLMGSHVNNIKAFLHQFIMTVPTQIVGLVLVLGGLFAFDWPMTLLTLLLVAAMVGVRRRAGKIVRTHTRAFLQEEEQTGRYVNDMLRGSHAVKIHAIEDRVIRHFTDRVDSLRVQGLSLAEKTNKENIKPEAVQYAGLTIIYSYGLYSCLYRGMEPEAFLAFVTTLSLLLQPLMSMFQLHLQKVNAHTGMERIHNILDVDTTTPEVSQSNRLSVVTESGSTVTAPLIGFRNVHFSYDDKRPALRGVDCAINDGETVALVGNSGSGKSTFVKLLLRLYEVHDGSVEILGKSIKNYGLQELRSQIGIVPQDPFLFQASIKENISVANPDASDEDIRRAMDLAQVSEFVDELPEGMDTLLGENGHNLSGGQRQRLAIARALVTKPRALVFDEATSALDNRSEQRIQKAIDKLMGQQTMIIVAHRLTTIRNVDRILVFDAGRIVQEGSYTDLAKRPGQFQDLLRAAQ